MIHQRRRVVSAILSMALTGGCIFLILLGDHVGAATGRRRVVINEALRTLLYLPLYHAQERGFFRDAGLDVEIVTGGTATASFAAMLSGEAQFSQADPMYVPISREKGAKTKVVAQVVGRIAVWGVTMDRSVNKIDINTLRGKKIATHPRPMTAYTYAVQTIKDAGLDPEKDVEIIQSTPGTEIAPLLARRADFAMTLEPNVSRAEAQGAHVVHSFPKLLGDQIFTGLMTTEKYIQDNRSTVIAVVKAYQRSLDDIHKNPLAAVATAKKAFPQLDDGVIRAALRRMMNEKVVPKSVMVSEDSWNKAVAVRVKAGDLRRTWPRSLSCDIPVMKESAIGK